MVDVDLSPRTPGSATLLPRTRHGLELRAPSGHTSCVSHLSIVGGRMQDGEKRPEWVIKRHLSAEALKEYVARVEISRSQVIAITEHQDGVFTLIFDPTEEQQTELASEETQVSETLDTLFGAPVTPVQEPETEEVETLITIPAGPLVAPPTAPTVEPSPS